MARSKADAITQLKRAVAKLRTDGEIAAHKRVLGCYQKAIASGLTSEQQAEAARLLNSAIRECLKLIDYGDAGAIDMRNRPDIEMLNAYARALGLDPQQLQARFVQDL